MTGQIFVASSAGNVTDGEKVVSITGQISHCLKRRKGDQIYCTVPFVDGKCSKPEIQIDHDGVAAVFALISEPIQVLDLKKVALGGIELDFDLNPERIADLATGISRLVEGRGWEGQAAAIIEYASLLAPQRNSLQ